MFGLRDGEGGERGGGGREERGGRGEREIVSVADSITAYNYSSSLSCRLVVPSTLAVEVSRSLPLGPQAGWLRPSIPSEITTNSKKRSLSLVPSISISNSTHVAPRSMTMIRL